MPKIPLYKQQVEVSSKSAGEMYDASPELRALGEITNVNVKGVSNLTSGLQKMADNYERLRDDAAQADARMEMIQFQNDMVSKKEESLKNPDIGFENFEAKVLQPSIDEMRNKLQGKNYGRAMDVIMPVVEEDFANMVQTERISRVKQTAENYATTLLNEATLLMLADTTYIDGVDQIQDMVEAGQISQQTANEAITNANDSYFSGIVTGVRNKADEDKVTSSDRFQAMSQIDQYNIRNKMAQARRKYFIEQESLGLERAKDLIKSEDLDPQKIRALGITDPNVIAALEVEYNKQLATAKREYDDEPGDFASLVQLDNRIKTLFLGQSKNPDEAFSELVSDIIKDDMQPILKNHYLEIIVDSMRTKSGFDVFAQGKQGESVYSDDVRDAWVAFWNTFDEANALAPAIFKNRQMVEAKVEFEQFLQSQRDNYFDTLPEPPKDVEGGVGVGMGAPFDARQASRTLAQKSKTAINASKRIIDQYGQLTYNQDGSLQPTKQNNDIIKSFINRIFSGYSDYKANRALSKALGIYVQTEADTQFLVSQPVFEQIGNEVIEASQE
jgi:hypothetical protein